MGAEPTVELIVAKQQAIFHRDAAIRLLGKPYRK